MAALDVVTLSILLGAVIVLAGILSSLVALRFGAPLLLIFLLIGLLAGEAGPLGIAFDDVRTAYGVGVVALGIILFDGGLRTRFQSFRSVIGPAGLLATVGVVITAALVAPVAALVLDLSWLEGLLLGTVIASTDAAAVFFLLHARGLRLRPRVSATLEVESGTNDPLAIFLAIVLIQVLLLGNQSAIGIVEMLAKKVTLGLLLGLGGGWGIVTVLNRLNLPQGLHAAFVATSAVVVFSLAEMVHGSGYLAAYLAGLVVGNRPTRAHNTIIVFLDAVTWLAQIAMFVILGLLAWPGRLPSTLGPALVVAMALTLLARPAAVFLCLWPFRFSLREKLFVSWVGLRGAFSIFLASIPLMVDMPKAYIYFDVALVVVLSSLLVQGWTIPFAAHRLHVALPRVDAAPRRVELDLPGQLAQELVGYAVTARSLYFRQRIVPSWAKLALVVRQQRVLSPTEADEIHEDDYVYFLAPPEKAQALDRFFVDMPRPVVPDLRLLGDFYVSADTTLAALGEIYGLSISDHDLSKTLAALFDEHFHGAVHIGDRVPIGTIQLIADRVVDGRVNTVGLDLAEPSAQPKSWSGRVRAWIGGLLKRLGRSDKST
jgi:potassium/hydrogen antiporter